MININSKLKRMGNSLGIIVPSVVVNEQGLKEGENLVVSIKIKKSSVGDMLREARKQKLKFKRPTQEILDELDEDWN